MSKTIRGNCEGANCGECPFAKDGKPLRPVAAEGPRDPMFIIIGDGPGKWESIKSRPFIGKGGGVLNKWALGKLGLKRENVWLDNAYICRPKPGASAAKKAAAAACCWPRLAKDLARMPNKPILALGGTAAQQLLDDKRFKITDLSGTWTRKDVDGTGPRDIIPTIHPNTILYGGKNKHACQQVHNLMYDAAKVADFSVGEEPTKWPIETYFRNIDAKAAERAMERMCRRARKEKAISCDLETVGEWTGKGDARFQHDAREPAFAKITTLGLATDDIGVSFAADLITLRMWEQLKKVFLDPEIRIIFHNRLYDQCVFHWHGIEINNVHCTLLQDHAAFPGIAHGLQRVTTRYFTVPPWKSEFKKGTEDRDNADLYTYNALDTLATHRIDKPLMTALKAGGYDELHALDLKMADAAYRMHVRGIPVCPETNKALHEEYLPIIKEHSDVIMAFWDDEEKREEFLKRLSMEQAKGKRKADSKHYGERVIKRREEITKDMARPVTQKKHFKFNLNARLHVIAWLLTEGVPLVVQTPSGGLSTDKEILGTFMRFGVVNSLLKWRAASKMYSTFVLGVSKMLKADGRAHPSWSVNKISGRWGSSPNWQNHPFIIRAQVRSRKGWKLVGADFAQLEARIIALLSGDEFLLSVFNEGHDLHGLCAGAVWPAFKEVYDAKFAEGFRGDDLKDAVNAVDKDFKRKRDIVKRPEYGVFYGADISTAYAAVRKDGYDIPISAVQNIMDMIKKQMKGVTRWHNELTKTAARTNAVETTILPRRRTFPLEDIDMNVVLNFPVQAEGAHLMNQGMAKLCDAIDREYGHLPLEDQPCPILQVHDSVVCEAKDEHAERVRELIEESLTQTLARNGKSVTFIAKADIGTCWQKV